VKSEAAPFTPSPARPERSTKSISFSSNEPGASKPNRTNNMAINRKRHARISRLNHSSSNPGKPTHQALGISTRHTKKRSATNSNSLLGQK
jgi:hypothetical protein